MHLYVTGYGRQLHPLNRRKYELAALRGLVVLQALPPLLVLIRRERGDAGQHFHLHGSLRQGARRR